VLSINLCQVLLSVLWRIVMSSLLLQPSALSAIIRHPLLPGSAHTPPLPCLNIHCVSYPAVSGAAPASSVALLTCVCLASPTFILCFALLDGVPLQARVNMSSSSTAPYRLFGNTTTAQDGVAKFTGLTVNGKPGDTVTLVFRTQNGLTVSRQVILRSCQAGEYTDNSTSVPNELSFSCRPCQSPQYSFYPSATGCSQCASLPPESWAVCNEAAVVPADGFYQSHPRSPVVSAVCECGGF